MDVNEKVLSIEDAETPNNIASIFTNDAHFVFDKSDKGQIDYSAFKNYTLIILNQKIKRGLKQVCLWMPNLTKT